jgi:hypothetical protein
MAHVNTFANIPIAVIKPTHSKGLNLAITLMHEIQSMLNTLLDSGQNGAVDLRARPSLGEGRESLFLRKIFPGFLLEKSAKNYATANAFGCPDSSSSPRFDPTRGRNIGSK